MTTGEFDDDVGAMIDAFAKERDLYRREGATREQWDELSDKHRTQLSAMLAADAYMREQLDRENQALSCAVGVDANCPENKTRATT